MWSDISVVATDLDGTLLRTDGSISDHTLDCLRAAANAGITVIVVTARPLRFVREFGAMNIHGLAICSNGALVVDLETDVTIAAHLLPAPDVRLIAGQLRDLIPGIAFAVETLDFYGLEPEYVPVWPVPPGSPVDSIERLSANGVIKLLGRHAEFTASQLDEVRDVIGTSATATCSTGSGLLEIGPAGVSKASALDEVVSTLGKTSVDVVAIGDMLNDIPTLSWARISVAVANAHPDVLAAVDFVVPSNDDDGVANLIDTLLESGSQAQ